MCILILQIGRYLWGDSLQFVFVSCIKLNCLRYRITVYVDDEAQLDEVTLNREEVNIDHLYIGGVINFNFPQGQAMAATTQGLEGCVSDIIINQQ